MTKDERKCVVANSGLRRRLAQTLSALYGIQPKALEIGATLCSKHGFTTHCVHFVNVQKLMFADLDFAAQMFVDRVYEGVKDEIAAAVRKHFKISSDFKVELVHNGDDADHQSKRMAMMRS